MLGAAGLLVGQAEQVGARVGQEYRVVLLGLRLFGGVQLKQILVLLRSECLEKVIRLNWLA